MPQQAQKHVTHNEAIRALDALVQPIVESRAANATRQPIGRGGLYRAVLGQRRSGGPCQ
ncbi:DUF2793 domain-containing protein [Devosia sp. A8/3-2]|nr:DUF2793 domain-containing protein [Devosia sp. A8/3-2]